MYLTDDLTNATKWQIPAGETIAPYGTLLVWCDEDGGQGPLHASFKLAAGGEVAALFDIDGQSLLDSFAFGPQLADLSTGRFSDGGAPWVTFDQPTPDAVNDSGCGLRTFSALDPTTLDMQLAGLGQPSVGMTTTTSITGGPAGATALLVLGPGAAHLPVPASNFPLLVDPTLWFLGLPMALDAAGAGAQAFLLPAAPALIGTRFVLQAAAPDTTSLRASNGLDIVICP